MNRVLVTGLGIGNEFGMCAACNLNYSWLNNNPSTLIWADKILIPQNAWEMQHKSSDDKYEKSINLVLDIAKEKGIIELFSAKDIFTEEVGDRIYNTVEHDIEKIKKMFPESITEGRGGIPNEIILDKEEYCGPYISSIYASFLLSEELHANCLLSDRDFGYLKYKYGVNGEHYSDMRKKAAMDEVFSVFLPENKPIHEYAYEPEEHCTECVRYEECKGAYLEKIEKNTREILAWREYDEIGRAKEELEKIIMLKEQSGQDIDPLEVKKEFQKKQEHINQLIKRVFPKIKRWTKLTTVLAVPLAIASIATGSTSMAIASASVGGATYATEALISYYEQKNSWVGFINDRIKDI